MIISISPETLSPQINSPEQIEETNEQVRGLEDENLTSDDDIQIEDLGEVSDSETEQQRGLNLKTVKVMLNRIIINPTSGQGHTGDQLFEEAEMSLPGSCCVNCSFCQADIRKEDLDAHQVSIQLPNYQMFWPCATLAQSYILWQPHCIRCQTSAGSCELPPPTSLLCHKKTLLCHKKTLLCHK